VESSEDAIYGKTLDSIIVSWNPAAERIYGYQAAEVIGRSIAILFPLDRRDELLEIMSSIRRGELVGFHQTERLRKDGRIIPVSTTISPIRNMEGQVIGASSIARDITKQKQADDERLGLIKELTEALGHVKKLSGLLPICASCKRIRDDQGYWQQVETYITRHTDAVFTHGICPECVKLFTREEKKLVPEF
jgi:PAS domain S-box-containing protein